MDASMWVAKTGLTAQSTKMTVIANNLANVNTVGFKKDRAMFEELLYQTIAQAGGNTDATNEDPTGFMLGTGTRIISTEKIHAQGNMISTENSFDLAVSGDGFFAITQPDGTFAYTRDGSFKLSSEGEVVTTGGLPLFPAITVPVDAASISIGRDGTVTAELAGGGGATQLGQIQLSRFLNKSGLMPMGRNLYGQTEASGIAETGVPSENGFGGLVQGMLEASNVNVVEEMVSMIETQRAYEINSKAISAADGMLRFLNNNL